MLQGRAGDTVGKSLVFISLHVMAVLRFICPAIGLLVVVVVLTYRCLCKNTQIDE